MRKWDNQAAQLSPHPPVQLCTPKRCSQMCPGAAPRHMGWLIWGSMSASQPQSLPLRDHRESGWQWPPVKCLHPATPLPLLSWLPLLGETSGAWCCQDTGPPSTTWVLPAPRPSSCHRVRLFTGEQLWQPHVLTPCPILLCPAAHPHTLGSSHETCGSSSSSRGHGGSLLSLGFTAATLSSACLPARLPAGRLPWHPQA